MKNGLINHKTRGWSRKTINENARATNEDNQSEPKATKRTDMALMELLESALLQELGIEDVVLQNDNGDSLQLKNVARRT